MTDNYVLSGPPLRGFNRQDLYFLIAITLAVSSSHLNIVLRRTMSIAIVGIIEGPVMRISDL
jgi:hypothetical protein